MLELGTGCLPNLCGSNKLAHDWAAAAAARVCCIASCQCLRFPVPLMQAVLWHKRACTGSTGKLLLVLPTCVCVVSCDSAVILLWNRSANMTLSALYPRVTPPLARLAITVAQPSSHISSLAFAAVDTDAGLLHCTSCTCAAGRCGCVAVLRHPALASDQLRDPACSQQEWAGCWQ